MAQQLAVVVHTCDAPAYQRLWNGFFYCWRKYQPKPWPKIYFMNEELPPYEHIDARLWNSNNPRLHWLPTGRGEWSTRLIEGLNLVPEKYVLYMQEDFWLRQYLSMHDIERMISCLQIYGGQAVRIMGSGERLMDSLHPLQRTETLRRFRIDSPYFFGHASTVWLKSHLRDCLSLDETPWMNCWQGNERCKRMDPEPVHFHFPFEWYHEVHDNVKRTAAWSKADGDRSLPGELSSYGQKILKEMNDGMGRHN